MISRKYKLHVLERKPTADFFQPSEILFRQNRSFGSVKTFFFFSEHRNLVSIRRRIIFVEFVYNQLFDLRFLFVRYCPGVPFAHI